MKINVKTLLKRLLFLPYVVMLSPVMIAIYFYPVLFLGSFFAYLVYTYLFIFVCDILNKYEDWLDS
jgi:hypothetical protein